MKYNQFKNEFHSGCISIYNGDCMDLLRQTPNKYYDLCIVDPPYGIGAGKEKPHNGWKDYGIKQWDNESPDEEYFIELMRVTKNQIIWGANHFISKLPYDFSCFIVWDKGQRNFSLADGEMAWTSFKSSARFFSYARAKALQEGKIHPTQKPVALYEWLVKNYAKQGDKILDTHLGSGSIAIAIEKANRINNMGLQFTGIELDEEYYNAALQRFKIFAMQQTIMW